MPDTPYTFTLENDLRPAYYDDFRCLAQGCRLSCCVGWKITFDKKDYLSLRRAKTSPELSESLQKGIRRIREADHDGPNYARFVMENGVCPLLGSDSLCRLQVEKGHGALPEVCRTFPRVEYKVCSGYLERSLSPACEGVLALLWDLPDGVEFRSDPLERAEHRVVPHPTPLQPVYQELRSLCIDVLQDRRYTLPERLLLMGLLLRELPGDREGLARWLQRALALLASSPDLRGLNSTAEETAFALFLSNNVSVLSRLKADNKDFLLLKADIMEYLQIRAGEDSTNIPFAPYLEARERYQARFGGHDCFMENLMVALFFHLHLPDPDSPESVWKSYVNFCNLYSFYRFMAVLSCRSGEGGRDELFRCLVHASRSLIHNHAQQTALRDEFFLNESATLAHMAILVSG